MDALLALCTFVFVVRTRELAKNPKTRVPRAVSREYGIVTFIIALVQLTGGLPVSSLMNLLTSYYWYVIYNEKAS